MPNPWMLMFDSFAISSSGAIGWLTLDARIRRSAMNLSIFILFSLSSSDALEFLSTSLKWNGGRPMY